MTTSTGPSNIPQHIYRLVFTGELLPGFEDARVRSVLARHLQRSPASLFSGKRVTVGEFADAVEAEMARQAMQALGAQVLLEEVEAPPPMPALGLLDVALPPAPAAPTQPQENFAKTDSPWQPQSPGPAPLPPLEDDLMQALAAKRPDVSLDAQESLPLMANMPQGGASFSAPTRPPTDLSPVFSASTATLASVVTEASPVFASAHKEPPFSPKEQQRSPAETAVPASLAAHDMGSNPLSVAESAPRAAEIPDAAWIRCPACREHQPMRVLCRACGADLKRALAAQQEERVQARASSVARGVANNKTTPSELLTQEEGVRVLGIRVPDEWAAKFTWPNVLLGLFGSLLVLATLGYLWRALGLDPIFSSSKPPPVAAASAGPAEIDPAASTPSSTTASDKATPNPSPAPPEAEVVARLSSPAAVADFRLRYWPQPTNKVFVHSSGGALAWSGGQPSVARAMAQAMAECESRRPATAAPCKVVNVNDYWQD